MVSKGGMYAPGDAKIIPLNRMSRLPLGHVRLFMSLKQRTKKEVIVLVGGLILITTGGLDCYTTAEARKSMSGVLKLS